MNRTDRRAFARHLNTHGGVGLLEAAGVDPRDVGHAFNRAAPGQRGGTTVDDVDAITIPDTPEGLIALLGDQRVMAQIFTGQNREQTAPEFIRKYAQTVLDKDQSIATQVREQVTATLHDWRREMDENGAVPFERIDLGVPTDVRNVPGPARHGFGSVDVSKAGLYNSTAMGAAIDREFPAESRSGDYFRAIWHNTSRDATGQARIQRIRNAFSSTVPSEGGFLIPEVLRSELLRVTLETAIMRPRARVIPMESLRVPFPAIDSTSNASSVYGGIVGYWTEEGAALTASQASFGRVVLDAKKLTMYTEAPNELISDSAISFQAFIDNIFPEAMGFYEDDAFINGSGVGMPLGVLNGANVISVAAESLQPADTIVWENVLSIFMRMLPSSMGRAVWLANLDTFRELATMALNVGTGGGPVWLTNGASGPPMTILGRPVIFTEKVPKLGDQGDLNFVDPGMYLIGDRQVMSAMSSPHYKFGNDMTAFRIIERVDGRPWMQSAITPKYSAVTLSPTVNIAAR